MWKHNDLNKILSKRAQLVLFVVVLFMGIFFVTVMSYFSERQFKDVKYITYADSLNGNVISRVARKGSVVVEFANPPRYQFPSSENENYDSYSINSFIQEGDSLAKAAFSDTLYIYRDKHRYYFVLNKVVRKTGE